VIACS